ncbi:MAG: hypothetical protein IKP95_02745 [Ruminococcus sp.]|nr:hypothetical protein [Ruminococcus sp.]MBR6872351.1 hypothetical protein [Ruminococcus sp.]
MILRKSIALLCAAALLASCADVPEDVKTSAGSSPADSTAASAAEAPAGDSTAESSAFGEYDNIKFAPTFAVCPGQPEDIGIYEAQRRTDLTEHSEEIFKAFFGEDFDSAGTVKTETDVSFAHDGIELHVVPNYIYFTDRNEAGKNLTYTNDDTLEALCEVTDSFMDERLALAEGEATVGELSSRLEGFVAGLKEAGLGEYRPFTLSSLTNAKQGRSLPTTLLTYRKYFKGLPVFNLNYCSRTGEAPELSYKLIESDSVSFVSADRFFSGGFSSEYTEVRRVGEADSILTPEQAVETASRELAAYLDLTALRLDLVYVPVIPEGAADNSEVTLTPYWQLAFGLQPLSEHYALINALTGKVIYYEERREQS